MEEQRYQHQTQNFWVRLVLLLCVLVWSIVVAVTRRSGSIAIIAYVFASICFLLMAFASTRMWQRWRDKEKRQVPLIPHRANNGTLGNGTLPNGTLPNGTSGYRGHAQPHWGTPQQPTHNPGLQWTPSDASSAGVAQALADGGSSRRITEVSREQMDKEPTSWWSRCEHPNCWSLRGTIMVFVLLMMSCVLATTGLIQYPPYHKTMTTLHERNAQITLDSTQSMIEELSTFSVDRLMAMVNDISLCAHRTAVDFADLRLHDGLPPLLLQRTLYSQVVRHNTTWAYMGQPDGMYTGVQRSNVPYAPSQPPRISMETTVLNSPPNGSFIQRWDVAQRAQILPSTARVVHQTYNVTGRPWFTEAVASNTLKMVSPYVWTGEYNVEIAVGIDACVPVFDDFSARKDGRLVAVTCCANHLQDLSLKMAENDIGVSYVVEAAGAGAGLLIAAAGEGKAIPVLQSIDPSEQDKHTTVGYSASGELYSRVAATESRDAMVAATSLFLLDNFGAWARVTQQFLSFSAEEVKALARTPMARTDTGEAALELVRHGVDVRIRKLDGRVEGMYVDDKGRWSKDLLQAKGVDWLVVHVLPRADVGSQGLTLSTEDVRDWSVLVIILLAISLLASLFLINLVVPPLKELEKNMEVMVTHTRKDWDMDEDRPVEKISSVQDIRRMQIAFSGMQKTLAIFRKFVPSAVIAKALSVDPDVRDQAGRAWIERDKCTIVHSTLRGLDKLPEDSVGYVLVGLHKALHQAIILENGVIIDFQGGEVLSFWNKKNNAHKNHAELACLAILSQQQAVLSLLRHWAPTIPHSKHLKCTFGAYTGKMYFGNFGTSSKLVYAVESGKVSLARRLDRMNLLHDSDVLVSESTVRKVDPSLFVESPAQAPIRPNPAGTTHTAVANRALPDLAESNAEAEAEERDADNNIDIDIDNDIDAPPLPVHRNWSYDSLGFGSSGRTVGGAGSRSSMRGSKSSLRTPKSASGSNASHVPASTRFEWRHVGELIMRQKTFEGVQNPSGGKNSKMEGAAFSASRRFNIQRTGSLHAQQQAKEAKEKEAKDQNKSVQVYQLVRQVDGDGPSEDEDKDDAAVQSVDSEEEGLGAAEDYILSVQAQGSAQHSREI